MEQRVQPGRQILVLQSLKFCCEAGIGTLGNSWEASEFLFYPLEMVLNAPFIHWATHLLFVDAEVRKR